MDYNKIGTMVFGVKTPIIKQNDNLQEIVLTSIEDALGELENDDIICITEAVFSISKGNIVTISDVVNDMHRVLGDKKPIALWNPVYSRNRFATILRCFARYTHECGFDNMVIFVSDIDEMGNPLGTNYYTGVNIKDYYAQICEEEGVRVIYKNTELYKHGYDAKEYCIVDARSHPFTKIGPKYQFDYNLTDFCSKENAEHHYSNFGLLGANVFGEDLKLFPNLPDAQSFVDELQAYILNNYGKRVEVIIYGDGCYKSEEVDYVDEDGNEQGISIWELCDPQTCVACSNPEHSRLNEINNDIKLKDLVGGKYKGLNDKELNEALKNEYTNNSITNKKGQRGITGRVCKSQVSSIADLASQSGSKQTPVVVVRNYFKNITDY